jgi:hypothetical protein
MWTNETPTISTYGDAAFTADVDRYAYKVLDTDTLLLSVNLSNGAVAAGTNTAQITRFSISMPNGYVAASAQRFGVMLALGNGQAFGGEAYFPCDHDTGEIIGDVLVISYGGGMYTDNIGGAAIGNNLHVNFNAAIEVTAA